QCSPPQVRLHAFVESPLHQGLPSSSTWATSAVVGTVQRHVRTGRKYVWQRPRTYLWNSSLESDAGSCRSTSYLEPREDHHNARLRRRSLRRQRNLQAVLFVRGICC